MRRRQRVTLRDKVRRQAWRRRLGRAAAAVKAALALTAVGAAGYYAHRFAFRSDFFSIRNVAVEPEGAIAKRIEGDMASMKGASILKVRTDRVESELMEKYPELRRVTLERSYPDGIKARYELRRPLAALTGRHSGRGADEDAAVFPLSEYSGAAASALPRLEAASEDALHLGLKFLKMWSEHSAGSGPGPARPGIQAARVDEYGDLVLFLNGPAGPPPVRIVWGPADPELFPAKASRLADGMKDLESKSIRAETINLRGVPEEGGDAGGPRVAGRVIVKPAAAVQ